MNNPKENLIVIIPAYEPPGEFVAYAKEVSSFAKALVVVNDGSKEEYSPIFEEISKCENVIYLTYEENHGKGYALKTAFKYCIENFLPDDILVTADCDGQHRIHDIKNVYRDASTHPKALMLGSRDFTKPNVPKRSLSGNIMMRRIFRWLYGIRVYDTQTGLRGFTVGMSEGFLSIKGNRFEFEMEMLIYAERNKVEILETPIDTVYTENPEEHISHFKTFSDSARVVGVAAKNLGLYFLSSGLSAVLDVLIFFLLTQFVLGEMSAVNTLIATVSARICSSILNFILNFKMVFRGESRSSIFKYYILWFFQLGADYGLTYLFGNLIIASESLLWVVKAFVSLFLAIISFQIQKNWVFKKRNPRKFWGPLARILKFFATTFSKRYRSNVLPYDEPVLYVARHLNMHGPYTTLKWLPFDVHPMIFSPFHTQGECYKQYRDYTFTVRAGKEKPKFHLGAFLASLFVPLPVKSLRSIPVYRGGIDSMKTFRAAMECFAKNESVIVYPDIAYTADSAESGGIYDGFLYLGEVYKRKTAKSLRIVPIYIDDQGRTLTEMGFVTVDSFKRDKDNARALIEAAINGTRIPSPPTDEAAE